MALAFQQAFSRLASLSSRTVFPMIWSFSASDIRLIMGFVSKAPKVSCLLFI